MTNPRMHCFVVGALLGALVVWLYTKQTKGV